MGVLGDGVDGISCGVFLMVVVKRVLILVMVVAIFVAGYDHLLVEFGLEEKRLGMWLYLFYA